MHRARRRGDGPEEVRRHSVADGFLLHITLRPPDESEQVSVGWRDHNSVEHGLDIACQRHCFLPKPGQDADEVVGDIRAL